MQITNMQGHVLSVEFMGDSNMPEEAKSLCSAIDRQTANQNTISLVMLLEHLKEENAAELVKALRCHCTKKELLSKVALIGDHDPIIAQKTPNEALSWEEKYFEIEDLNAAWQWANN